MEEKWTGRPKPPLMSQTRQIFSQKSSNILVYKKMMICSEIENSRQFSRSFL